MKLSTYSNANENAKDIIASSSFICSSKMTLDNMGKIHCPKLLQASTCESTAMHRCHIIGINYLHKN
jgi:hypothetical protein